MAAGCEGAVFGTGVCGTPEPGFGVAGLFCAQPQRPIESKRKRNASDALGERCIVFKGLRTPVSKTKALKTKLWTLPWMQRAAAQMAGKRNSGLPNLREGFAIQQTSRATALRPYLRVSEGPGI